MIEAARRRRASAGGSPGGAWFAVVGLLAAAAAISLLTPPIANAALRVVLGRVLGTGDIQVTAAGWPPPAMWWGQVDVLAVAARHLRVGTLDVDAFDATLNRVQFDPTALYAGRALVIRSLGSGVAHMTVTQEALAALLAAQPSLRDVAVALAPGRVSLGATVSVLGASLRATAAGRLALRGDTAVDLVLDQISVGGMPLPGAVADALTRSVNPVLDVRSLPFGLRLTGLTVVEGKAMLQAATGHEATGHE